MRLIPGPFLGAVCAAMLLAAAGCGDGPKAPPPAPKSAAKVEAKAATMTDAETRAERYLAAKERLAALLPEDRDGPKRILAELGAGLREVAEGAPEVPLRANASLLLGTLHERSGDHRSAISFYRQALALLPEEIEPRRVLALALAADGQYAAAVAEQEIVIRDDPDDLAAWLLLGELNVKAERKDEAAKAYVAYELRRKGLLDGLTLQNKDGTYLMPVDQRAACARALIPAADNGTAMALLYALERDVDPVVRQAVAEAMGTQRLAGYKAGLTAKAAAETHPEAKAAMLWALQEIERDPLETRPGPAPDVVAGTGAQGQGEAAAAAGSGAGATGTGAQGQGEVAAGTGSGGQGEQDRRSGASGAAPAK